MSGHIQIMQYTFYCNPQKEYCKKQAGQLISVLLFWQKQNIHLFHSTAEKFFYALFSVDDRQILKFIFNAIKCSIFDTL